MVQGSNSVYSRFAETSQAVGEEVAHMIIHGYIGPCPPDKDHVYTIQLFALDTELDLDTG